MFQAHPGKELGVDDVVSNGAIRALKSDQHSTSLPPLLQLLRSWCPGSAEWHRVQSKVIKAASLDEKGSQALGALK